MNAAAAIGRVRANGGAVWLLGATTFANVLAYLYQVVMARLLAPADYAILTALMGILLLENISAQVIQLATAKLAAQYRARDEHAALHVFVRRWLLRIVAAGGPLALTVVVLAGFIAAALSLSTLSVMFLGVSLLFAAVMTFTFGLLQGLGRFGAFGTALIATAATRLTVGVALVLAGTGVDGAFFGATVALLVGVAVAVFPQRELLHAARRSVAEPHLAAAETRFFLLAAVVLLAYAALTNVDAVLARALLPEDESGAYAGAITMAKIALFAPIAVGFILLERTARAHARGEPTERPLFLSLAFVLLTSGAVAVAYVVAPAFFTSVVVGAQYARTADIVGTYGIASLLNALLSLWIAYFIGRGEMRVGILLAIAVAAEIVLLVVFGRDATTMVRVVLGVAIASQAAAVATFFASRRR